MGSISGLEKHFRRTHNDSCPVCKKKVNNLGKHLTKMKDDDHLVLWYLYNNLKGVKDKELKKKIRKIVKEKLKVETVKAT